MDMPIIEPGRCPGKTYQDIAHGDEGPLASVLELVSAPSQSTEDIPFERYTSQAFFDREIAKMWSKVWQYACRDEHVPEVGDYYVYDIGRRSILVTRSENGLKAYHNSCIHRGTKLKPSGSAGWSAQIGCPFHGWTWNLDGTLKDIPCRWDFEHVRDDDARLAEVQVASWNGFIFINMDLHAAPLLDYLEVVPEHFRNWDLTGWYIHNHVQKELPANWKLGQEAFMEQYHTPTAHPEMTHVVADWNAQHDIFSRHISRDLTAMASPSPVSTLNLSQQELLDSMLVADRSAAGPRAIVPEGSTARTVMAQTLRQSILESAGLDLSHFSVAEMVDSIKYNIFPNLFIYPGAGLPMIYQFRPLGNDPDRCLFDQMILRPVPKDRPRPAPAEVVRIGENDSWNTVPDLDPFLASVLDQDTSIMRWQCEGMYASQKGAQSLSNHLESRIRHTHHTLDIYLDA